MKTDYEEIIVRQWETPIEIYSKRRKVLYVFQGHKYHKKRETLVYIKWSCYIKSCVGFFKVGIKDENIFEQKEHDHEAMTQSELRLLIFRESMLSDSIHTRKTANDIICSASTMLDDAKRQQLPKISSLKKNIRRQQSITNSYSYSYNYDIPYELLTTRSGNKFVQYDNYKSTGKRLIALWCGKNINEAMLSNTFAVDGTFYACPKPFYQLFVTYYVKDSKFIPFCYFLLPDKKQDTYKTVLNILKTAQGRRTSQIFFSKKTFLPL